MALLKLPTGALTALVALIAIRGEFVPGLTMLDSQEQVLAYAVVFGYLQQAVTSRIDKQGRKLLNMMPGKDKDSPHVAVNQAPQVGAVQQPAAEPAEPPTATPPG